MEKEFFNWNSNVHKKEKKSSKKVLSLPIIEMSDEDYFRVLTANWFSEEFYDLIKKHKFSIVIKNIKTGEKTLIHTFGARFPLVISKIA